MFKLSAGCLGLFLIFIFGVSSCGFVETGNVGVRTNFDNKVEMQEINPGFYTSFLSTVNEYIGKEIEVVQNDLTPKAKDNLTLRDLDISVFYKANSDKIAEMKVKYAGMDVKTDSGKYLPAYFLVQRYIRGAIYDVIGNKYESLTIHNRRNELETDIHNKIQEDLDSQEPGVFYITKVIVRQALTDPALEESIQRAVRVQKEIEAKIQAADLAKAEAERMRVESEGVAVANRIVSDSLTDKLLEMRRIEMQEKLAQEGTHTIFMDTKNPIMFGNVK